MKGKSLMKWGLGLAVLPLLATGVVAEDVVKPVTQADVADLQNNMNILWTSIAAFLVFFMQAGFAMVESGFTRAKNACNIMMKNLIDFSVGSLAWWAVGFGLMFGAGSGWFGGSHFFASDFTEGAVNGVGSSLNWSFFIFQCVFAGTAATIVSGAVAGRTKFTGYIAFSACICAFIYPISGHWYWGSLFGSGATGWVEGWGFIDFAGSTVVHSCGAWLALAGAIVLGPRIGKYVNGESKPIVGHNIPLASLGVFILWLGWFGFNPGSTTTADSSIGYIAVTTNLAAAAGALTAMMTSWIRAGKPDVSMSMNGVLAGLVSITAGCADVTFGGAVIIGAIAGCLVVLSVEFIDKVIKIDDPVGAVSVHGVCGAFGSIALVFFLKETPEAGIGKQLIAQLVGVGTMFLWAFGSGLILFTVIKKTIGLRASEKHEMVGLDISEHGNEAYHGFQIFSNH